LGRSHLTKGGSRRRRQSWFLGVPCLTLTRQANLAVWRSRRPFLKPKVPQHKISVEAGGRLVVGHYTLERVGRWDRLTVWFRSRSAVDPEIAHEAEPSSTEMIARGLLSRLAEEAPD
jgi:hypothetical protein